MGPTSRRQRRKTGTPMDEFATMGQPRPVQLPDGTTSTTPSAHLDFEVNKYTALWCPTDQHEDINAVAHPELLDPEVKYITAESFRAASGGFSTSTSSTYDGFHVTHWKHLSPQGTEAMASFLQLCFALGSMPTQCLASVGNLIPKAKKGNRQIAMLPSIYRVAVKHEGEKLRQWEAQYAHPAFSFQSGQNCLHRVFIQSAQAESATAGGAKSIGMVL